MIDENRPFSGLTPEQEKMAIEFLGVGGLNAVIRKTNEIVGTIVTSINADIKERKEDDET